MASQDWFEKDFYAILGVAKDADEKAIKKRYHKLARELHPDHNVGNAEAERKFKEVGEAYSVLSDKKQREEYDAIRAMAGGGPRFAPGAGGAGGFEDIFSQFGGAGGAGRGGQFRFDNGGGAGNANIDDILSQMFGGGGFQGGGRSGGARSGGYADDYGSAFPGGFGGATRGPRPGQDVHADTTISFRAATTGETVTLQSPELGTIKARIPAGVRDGQKIRLKGKGLEGDPGAPKGNLILTVHVEAHPVFGRDGDNLTVDLPVTFAEAALGATVAVPTLDGGRVKVRIAPGTPSGRVLRVKGRGVTHGSTTGDLMAKVQVVVPQRLTDEAREAIEKMAQAEAGHDPRADLYARAGD